MKQLALILSLAIPLASSTAYGGQGSAQCEHGKRGQVSLGSGADVIATDEPRDADNTGRNERDRDGGTLTPMDQGNSEADRTITQQIRKAVVDHNGLSTNAQNVKIITVDGVVTLRGPVKTAEEKTTIEAVAEKTSGVKRVDNQLEVERDL
jgi:hyperosmotically inducible periplasmic protein